MALRILEDEVKPGDIALVTAEEHKNHHGRVMFCIGISRHGFVQLAERPNAPIADVYLGKAQCKKVEFIN